MTRDILVPCLAEDSAKPPPNPPTPSRPPVLHQQHLSKTASNTALGTRYQKPRGFSLKGSNLPPSSCLP